MDGRRDYEQGYVDAMVSFAAWAKERSAEAHAEHDRIAASARQRKAGDDDLRHTLSIQLAESALWARVWLEAGTRAAGGPR